jgi:hypothetical protein
LDFRFGYTWPKPNVDLEVWSLTDYHAIPSQVEESGPISSPGRFGVFIPRVFVTDPALLELYPYTKFASATGKFSNDQLREFDIQDAVLQPILRKAETVSCVDCTNNVFTPSHCAGTTCAYLLAADFYDTSFVMLHINEMRLKLKVIWLGSRLKKISKELLELYTTDAGHKKRGSKFLVFSWTPSDVIDSTIDYIPVVMPRCEEMRSSNLTGCKYELTPLLKYIAQDLNYAEVTLKT